jgi:hypothetical protein
MSAVDVHTPSGWGESHYFYEGIEDLRQRRALALISAFGNGGTVKVAFVADQIVIAALPDPMASDDDLVLVVRPLDEFIENFTASNARDADSLTLRWIEKIVQWPDLGC